MLALARRLSRAAGPRAVQSHAVYLKAWSWPVAPRNTARSVSHYAWDQAIEDRYKVAQEAIQHGLLEEEPLSTETAEKRLATIFKSSFFEDAVERDIRSQKSQDENLRKKLQQTSIHPMELFEKLVTANVATMSTAGLCLEAFNQKLRSMPVSAARVNIKETRAGARVLQWILRNRDFQAFGDNLLLLDYLAHFLIAEEEEDTLWRFLALLYRSMPRRSTRTSQDISSKKFNYAGRFGGSVIHAHTAREIRKNADVALRAHARLHELHKPLPPQESVSLVPSTSILLRVFKERSYSVEDPKLFDLFVWGIRHASYDQKDGTPGSETRQALSNMLLRGPRHPDPQCALDFFRHVHRTPDHKTRRLQGRPRISILVPYHKTYEVLRAQGRRDDAYDMKNIVAQIWPKD